jgi:hypothetical protein
MSSSTPEHAETFRAESLPQAILAENLRQTNESLTRSQRALETASSRSRTTVKFWLQPGSLPLPGKCGSRPPCGACACCSSEAVTRHLSSGVLALRRLRWCGSSEVNGETRARTGTPRFSVVDLRANAGRAVARGKYFPPNRRSRGPRPVSGDTTRVPARGRQVDVGCSGVRSTPHPRYWPKGTTAGHEPPTGFQILPSPVLERPLPSAPCGIAGARCGPVTIAAAAPQRGGVPPLRRTGLSFRGNLLDDLVG